MAESPDRRAELERILRRAARARLAFASQAGEGLVHLLRAQRRTQLDDADHLDRARVHLRVPSAGRDHDRLSRADDPSLTFDDEVRFAGDDQEALLLMGMKMLGDRAARRAAPVEADHTAVAVGGRRGELDLLTGRRVGDPAVTAAVSLAVQLVRDLARTDRTSCSTVIGPTLARRSARGSRRGRFGFGLWLVEHDRRERRRVPVQRTAGVLADRLAGTRPLDVDVRQSRVEPARAAARSAARAARARPAASRSARPARRGRRRWPARRPNSLSVRSLPSMNERKTQTMIAAAAVITRPVSAMPSATAPEASPRRSHCSRTRETRNTS